jgi:tetratricopeptide (TPR) repeat protein
MAGFAGEKECSVMARKEWLSCLEKRDLLNQSAVSVEALIRWGEHYEREGLVHDAVDFYEKANAREPLARMRENALQSGDYFLCLRVCRVLGCENQREEWLALARRAEELGKFAFAAQAYRRAGEEDRALGCESATGDEDASDAPMHKISQA